MDGIRQRVEPAGAAWGTDVEPDRLASYRSLSAAVRD